MSPEKELEEVIHDDSSSERAMSVSSESTSESDSTTTVTKAELYDKLARQKHENKELRKQIQTLTEQNNTQTHEIHELKKQIIDMQLTLKAADANTRKLHTKIDKLLEQQTKDTTQKPSNLPPSSSSRADNTRKHKHDFSSDDDTPKPKKPDTNKNRTLQTPTPKTSANNATQNATRPQTPSAQTATPPTDKTPQVPPVILRKQDRWMEVQKLLTTQHIRYTKAKLINDGVAIYPCSPQDHRALTRTLTDKGEEYHTFTLSEERTLRVVIRGIPAGITPSEVQLDLEQQGFPGAIVHRMAGRQNRQEMPLVLVQAQADQESILQVTRCCSLVVRVERQRKQQVATQCHRCQRFGHGQSRCTAAPKCVKCGENHSTHECKKTRDTPARCANCAGPHPASYLGCPKYPKSKQTKTPVKTHTPTPTQTAANTQPTPAPTPGTSYADMTKKDTTTNTS
ncbi:hypothetical protein NQ315_012428 [Exocentrus adspersus]|uniref:Pre-C2HC domain-containing protein n=1 Tax=Exocentrus adspersus TaxID=1586481 RepID=A0AAV8VP22_9CUCU|nr:hypothetical protein NQ315_012428 [Exocentrus adspersus]